MTQRGATAPPTDADDDLSPLTPVTARSALEASCRRVGLDPSGAELIRIGSNAVFRLRSPVIVRIAQGQDVADSASRQVEVARWLQSADYPATRALAVDQPVQADGRVATFWESASDREDYAPIAQVADLIRRLHELEAPNSLDLPAHSPFARVPARLRAAGDALTSEDRRFLESRIAEARARYSSVKFSLQGGVIHGDANVGNVILDTAGEPILIDLDNFCRGPREWDLVKTALYFDRFGWHTSDEYSQFCAMYGFDIMEWDGYEAMADVDELLMVVWLSQNASKDTRSRQELEKRLTSLRHAERRKDWSPL